MTGSLAKLSLFGPAWPFHTVNINSTTFKICKPRKIIDKRFICRMLQNFLLKLTLFTNQPMRSLLNGGFDRRTKNKAYFLCALVNVQTIIKQVQATLF